MCLLAFQQHYNTNIIIHTQNISMYLSHGMCGTLCIVRELNRFIVHVHVYYKKVSVFSAPEPKAQVHYCDHALSVVRPSSLTFHIFDFFSETAKRNSTKLDRKQDLNVLYKVCVFRADRKNKMAALASDWLRHFRLLLWHRWTEFNETWQEARSQCPLPRLCFSGRSDKQDGHPGL